MLPCCRYQANSNPTFSTFRHHGPGGGQGGGHGEAAHHGGRQCYATRHQDTRGHGGRGRAQESKTPEPNGYRSDGGYKSDGYRSDGEGYKSDRDGYKSDGGGYRSEGERLKAGRRSHAHARYGASPSRKPSKYELDRLAARGRHARHPHNGDSKARTLNNVINF